MKFNSGNDSNLIDESVIPELEAVRMETRSAAERAFRIEQATRSRLLFSSLLLWEAPTAAGSAFHALLSSLDSRTYQVLSHINSLTIEKYSLIKRYILIRSNFLSCRGSNIDFRFSFWFTEQTYLITYRNTRVKTRTVVSKNYICIWRFCLHFNCSFPFEDFISKIHRGFLKI